MKTHYLLATLLLATGAHMANAQTGAGTVQRDVNQQNRIEQGLQNGSLNTREAGRLEREEGNIDRIQARDLRDGKLTPREREQLRRAQDRASRDIQREESNKAMGNPQSASSQRMQADVQRNANQESRIQQGIQSGQLTPREASRLERGQGRVDRAEAHAARDGHVGGREEERIQRREHRQSDEIFQQKHDGQHRPKAQ